MPHQVSPPIPTHQEQVPEPYKWTEVGGMHHSSSGSEANQQEGSAFHRHPPRRFQRSRRGDVSRTLRCEKTLHNSS